MRRPEQVSEELQHHAANFLSRESNRDSLITVTGTDMSPDFRNVTFFLSVMPEAREQQALAFAKRSRTELREYLKEHSKLHPIPNVDFEIDYGEKNRQRVDDLTRS